MTISNPSRTRPTSTAMLERAGDVGPSAALECLPSKARTASCGASSLRQKPAPHASETKPTHKGPRMIEQDSRLALGLAYIQARLSSEWSGGVDPCTEYLQSELRKHAQSNASSCGVPQQFADLPNSLYVGKPYTPQIQPQNSHPKSDAACGRPNTSLADNSNHRRSRSAPLSTSASRLGRRADA
jgi:hypothetical protein